MAQCINQHFTLPKSNRGFTPSIYIHSLLLMQHKGSFHLDEARHLRDDDVLREVVDFFSDHVR